MFCANCSSEDIKIVEQLHFESEFVGFIHMTEDAENASLSNFGGKMA